MNNDTSIPKQVCPHCGYKMDATTHAFGNAKPEEGDISMCLGCGAASKFTKDLIMRKPTTEEQDEINKNPEVIQAQLARAYIVGDKIKNRRKP